MKLKDFNFRVDIKRTIDIEPFTVVQGDFETNVFNITLLDGDTPYDLYNLDVKIVFKKADGTTVEQSDIEKENEAQGKIRCVLKTNTIACPGKVTAEIKILDNEKTLTSTKFGFNVRKSLLDDETVESSNEFSTLRLLISETNELIDAVRQIEEQVPENVLDRIEVLESLTETMESQIADIQSQIGGQLPEDVLDRIDTLEDQMTDKFDKSDIVNVHTNSTTKVPSAALAKSDHDLLTTLNDKLAVQTGTVTAGAGVTVRSSLLKKSNNTAELTFNCTKSDNSTITARTLLFTLPSEFIPATTKIYTVGAQTVIDDVVNRTAILLVFNNGNVYMDPLTSDCKQIVGSVTFRLD